MDEPRGTWYRWLVLFAVVGVLVAIRRFLFERNLRSYDPMQHGKSVADAELEGP
jgi:hypothetical protein